MFGLKLAKIKDLKLKKEIMIRLILLVLYTVLIGFTLYFLLFQDRTKIVFYEHKPSKKFLTEKKLNEHNPLYVKNDVHFVITFKEINHIPEYIVWQSFFSKSENKNVYLEKAVLKMGLEKKEIIFNRLLEINKNENNIFTNDIKLFTLKGKDLEKSNSLSITIFFKINNTSNIIKYDIKRIVKEYTIFST